MIAAQKTHPRGDHAAWPGSRPATTCWGCTLEAYRRATGQEPLGRESQVRRFFPHTLSIAIAEREPVAVVNMGFLYYLDEGESSNR